MKTVVPFREKQKRWLRWGRSEAELGDSDSDHRIIEWLVVEEVWHNPCPNRDSRTGCPVPHTLWLLKISKKETTQPLGTLCSINCTAQKCYLVFRKYRLCCNLCPLALLLALDTIDQRLALSSLHHPHGYLQALMKSPSHPSNTG